jgi:hypothetical protein
MMQKKMSSMSAFLIGVFMFAAIQVNVAHALITIEDGCLDCHYRGSSIVPDTKQFENGTSWHSFHKDFSCSSCHPGSAGSKPISVADCRTCHNSPCSWQDFHENNVGRTCYECHTECDTQLPETRTVNLNKQEALVRIPGTVMVKKPVTAQVTAWRVIPLTVMMV